MDQENFRNLDDEMLLFQLSQGSEHAFDILFDRYWKDVFNNAYKRLNNVEVARDITGEVFSKLETRDTSRKIYSLSQFLSDTTRESLFEHLQRQG